MNMVAGSSNGVAMPTFTLDGNPCTDATFTYQILNADDGLAAPAFISLSGSTMLANPTSGDVGSYNLEYIGTLNNG